MKWIPIAFAALSIAGPAAAAADTPAQHDAVAYGACISGLQRMSADDVAASVAAADDLTAASKALGAAAIVSCKPDRDVLLAELQKEGKVGPKYDTAIASLESQSVLALRAHLLKQLFDAKPGK